MKRKTTDSERSTPQVAPHVRRHREWTPLDAEAMAWRLGVGRLADHHWKVLTACREEAARAGKTLDRAHIEKLTGLTRAELGRLFPGRSEILIARIAGLPVPTTTHLIPSPHEHEGGNEP